MKIYVFFINNINNEVAEKSRYGPEDFTIGEEIIIYLGHCRSKIGIVRGEKL